MAQAVKRLFPDVQIGIGPPIENGYYYDFLPARPFTPEDLERIGTEHVEVAETQGFHGSYGKSRFDTAENLFASGFYETPGWQRAQARKQLLALYQKGKDKQWDTTKRIDWDLPVVQHNPIGLPDEFNPFRGVDFYEKMSQADAEPPKAEAEARTRAVGARLRRAAQRRRRK